MGTKALGAAAGFTSGLVAWPSGIAAVLVTGAILAAAGFALPDIVLARRNAFRRSAAAAAAPDLLDVLAIGVTAGLTPRLALERGAAVVEGPLAEELAGTTADLELGLPWREVLGGLVDRTGSADLRRLATTLQRSERLGTPVAERLRALAREVREERRAREEERARRAPVIMLLPLVFLILPAFVVSAVVPALLVAARSIQ
jgi:tight adherence protein C